jgi:hypothetical protein
MKNVFLVPILFLLGIISFIIFAYDIENDRDIYTWSWLLNSIILFILSIYTLLIEIWKDLKDKS